jgi:hypothetical protein
MWKVSSEKPRTVLAGKGLVREFNDMEPVPYDRPLSERRVEVYRRILKAGEFRPVTWASVLCQETNCVYRVNGKHTAHMLAGMDPLPEFYVTVERYVCDTLQDAANLYNTFDSKMASRSTNDINWAFAATIPDLRDCPKRLINLTVGAAAFRRWGEKAKDVPPAERAEELMDSYRSPCGCTPSSRPRPAPRGRPGTWSSSRSSTPCWRPTTACRTRARSSGRPSGTRAPRTGTTRRGYWPGTWSGRPWPGGARPGWARGRS